MIFKRLAVAFSGLLALALLTLAATDAAGPQLLIQTKTIALDPLTDQHRGGMKWSHGGFLFQGGGADGRTERVIRTAPYWPYMLSIALDGTFWTLGFEMVNDKISAPELDPNAAVLRHFDRAGKLLGSTGPQSHFVKDSASEHRLTLGFIAATRNRIGWYGQGPETGGQYVEIDLNSMTMHRYPGLPDLPEGDKVVDFNLTESGNVLLSLYSLASNRWTVLTFDRAALKWLPIKGPVASESPGSHPIGVDGEELVYQSWKSAIFFSLSH
jgi:hypothetical protein